MQLPGPHDPDRPYTIALVCLGNICRSPIADVVLEHRLAERGLDPPARDVLALARTDEDRSRVAMFRSFDPRARTGDDEVPDPWGGGPDGFEQVRAMIERTVDGLVEQLAGR